jgi:hypothetical protein
MNAHLADDEFGTVDQYVRAFEVTRTDMPVELVQAILMHLITRPLGSS